MILTVNVRSLDANFSNLELLIDSCRIRSDVIICTETWSLHNYNYYKLRDYTHYYNHSRINISNKAGIYIKMSLSHRHELIIKNESVFLSIVIICCIEKLKITTVYRCHTLTKNTFIENLSEFLLDNKLTKNHIITGDFNIDLLRKDSYAEDFVNSFLQGGYLPYFNGVTRPSNDDRTSGTCNEIFLLSQS